MQYLFTFCVSVSMAIVTSLPDYQQRIPNGHRVPHPCFANSVWGGVGHQNPEGGGFLNPFGEHFRLNGFKWDACLCMADSDGDGVSNGEELGDPHCTWSEGDGLPEVIEGLSHPGVCEPIDSAVCMEQNTWDICEPIEFQCDNVDNDPDVTEADLRFVDHELPANETTYLCQVVSTGVCEPIDSAVCMEQNTWDICEPIEFQCDNVDNDPDVTEADLRFVDHELPANETTYLCQVVEFDDTKELHAVAMEAIVVNRDLVHHIDLHACSNDEAESVKEYFSSPQPCGAMATCSGMLIAAWALGVPGICLSEEVGIRVGKGGASVAMLRIHYHNPFHKVGERDTSGLKMYVTENLRPNDAQIVNNIQAYLEIPPGLSHFTVDNKCHGGCTALFDEPINLMFGSMHMHYLGTGGFAEIWRDGKKVKDIMSQDFYDYNSPHIEYFEPLIVLNPGDEIRYTCHFQSRDRTEVTYRGQSALDEMCEVLFVYYPGQNISKCSADGELHSCKFTDGKRWMDKGDCDWNDYEVQYEAVIKPAVLAACDTTGMTCYEGCAEVTEWAGTNHTCLQGNTRDATLNRYDEEFLYAMNSCKVYPTSEPEEEQTEVPPFLTGNCTIGGSGNEGEGSGQSAIHGCISLVLEIGLLVILMVVS